MPLYRSKTFVSDTYRKLSNVSQAKHLYYWKIAVLVFKGHHSSLAIGNLTCSIRRTECLRQLAVPRVLLSANRSKLGLRLCQAKTAGLKAGSLQGHKNGVLGVTRQSVGTVPTKVGMFWPAFRLINCVDLSGRCLPCRNGMVTHNALQDVSNNNDRCTCCMRV